jgi:hypothetical protein
VRPEHRSGALRHGLAPTRCQPFMSVSEAPMRKTPPRNGVWNLDTRGMRRGNQPALLCHPPQVSSLFGRQQA